MEISAVRNRVPRAIEAARARAQQRRARAAEADRAYQAFLQDVATPIVRQVANALKAEGYAFTVFTPADSLRLASDRSRDDYIEITLDTADDPQVVGRISHARGSRIHSREHPLKPGVPPGALTDEDVLAFLLDALEPWLER